MQLSNKEEKLLEIDFTKEGELPFRPLWRKTWWRPLQGEWEVRGDRLETRYKENGSKDGENILLIGSKNWSNYTLMVEFSFLSRSIRVDEGGVILYFRYRNSRNHYSFHFCISKQRVELWKRFRGEWSLVGEGVPYSLQINRPYSVRVSSEGSEHSCYIDEEPVLRCIDPDTGKGSVGLGVKYCGAGFKEIQVIKV